MERTSLATLLLVIAILLIMVVVAEVFVDDVMRTNSLFFSLLVNVLISGVLTSVIFEKMDAKILR